MQPGNPHTRRSKDKVKIPGAQLGELGGAWRSRRAPERRAGRSSGLFSWDFLFAHTKSLGSGRGDSALGKTQFSSLLPISKGQ